MQTRAEGKTLAYITQTFVREPPEVAAIRHAGERRRAGMQVSAYEGALLAWLVRLSGAARILEVGTFMGYSTMWMATALPEHGTITTLESQASHAQQARDHFENSPHAARIELVEGEGLAWMVLQPATPCYDFMFIDAEKRHYANYLEAALPLLQPGAWIVGDNTLLFGALSGENSDAASQASIAAMQKFNQTLADPTRFDTMMLPTPEGLTVARLK